MFCGMLLYVVLLIVLLLLSLRSRRAPTVLYDATPARVLLVSASVRLRSPVSAGEDGKDAEK